MRTARQRVRAVARDITAIYEARLSLAESEQRFKSLAENSPVAIYQSDANNEIVYCNEKWGDIFGINKETFSSDRDLRYIHKDDRRRVGRGVQEYLCVTHFVSAGIPLL